MPHERPKTKRYASRNDLFLFFVFWIVTKKTGNTGTEKLCGRTHPMMHGVYLLYRLLGDNSTKSYGEEKTNQNSTNHIMLHQSTVALERKCHPAAHVVPSSQSGAAGQGVGGKEASEEESRPLPSVLAGPVPSWMRTWYSESSQARNRPSKVGRSSTASGFG
jgi:hypothetical protein